MSALVKKLRAGSLPVFDYTGIGDPAIEQRAREAVLKIRELQKVAVVDIGRELLAVKEILPKGQFLHWVESFGLERRTAVNYMHVAAEFGSVWETVSHIPAGVLYKLAAPSTPPEVREAVIQIGPGKTVTLDGVRELIDGLRSSALRKDRRDRREEIRQEQEEARAKWEVRDAEDREKRKQQVEAARGAAEKVKDMLGGHFDEVADLLGKISPHWLAEELDRLARQHRARQQAGAAR